MREERYWDDALPGLVVLSLHLRSKSVGVETLECLPSEIYLCGYLWRLMSCAVVLPGPLPLQLLFASSLQSWRSLRPRPVCGPGFPIGLCFKFSGTHQWLGSYSVLPAAAQSSSSASSLQPFRFDRLKAQTLRLRGDEAWLHSLVFYPNRPTPTPHACRQGPVHASTARGVGLLLGCDITFRCVRGHWVVLRVG